jgi:Xaa-Pro aminopeptidase
LAILSRHRARFPRRPILKICASSLARSVSILVLFSSAGAPVHARFRQSNSEYQASRAKLRSLVQNPIVIFGYSGHESSSEVAVFFQEPYFYYLTGHDEPGAALVIVPESPNDRSTPLPKEILYLPPRDIAQEKWDGPKLGPLDPGIAEKTGFQTVEPIANLQDDLQKLAKLYPRFSTLLPPQQEEGYPHFGISVGMIRTAVPHEQLVDVTSQVDALRQVKSPGELSLMQKAIDLSVDAHLDAMKTMHAGSFEYQVAARMQQIHEMGGCSREAYAPIVGAGFNSTVLHYSGLNDPIANGDMVVIDVGGEYGSYAADITRTLPAGGKFTPRQREIYDIVLGAQNAAIAAVKPGALLYGGSGSLQQIATDYINTHGRDKQGRTLGQYYPHGISHHLGLDVHDPGDRSRPLEAGMVITVEPGIYIPEEKLGVRIEDDVLVTKEGHEILTARLPRTADEVESAMAGQPALRPQ